MLTGRGSGCAQGRDPDHHAHYLWRQLEVFLAGARALVPLGQRNGQLAAWVLADRRQAADLHVLLRVVLVVGGQADPRPAGFRPG